MNLPIIRCSRLQKQVFFIAYRWIALLLGIGLGASLSWNVWAEPRPDVVAALAEHIGNQFSVLNDAAADLDRDGQEDWVGVVKIQRASQQYLRIYVLKRTPDGLKVTAASREVDYMDCAGRCGTEIYSVKPGRFFVLRNNHGGWGSSGEVTQFALRQNRWKAVGLSRTDLDFQKDQSVTIDVNLLTGEYKSTLRMGSMSGQDKPPRIKRGIRGEQKPLWFEAYDPLYF